MYKFIEYFIENKRLNYALLLFLLYMGINAYINIPKEIFPNVELDKISVSGKYAGASATNMDKMAVRDIEDELSNINGIDKTETIITPGSFAITLTLNKDANKINLLNKVQDAIALSRQYLPSDMVEPTAKLLDKSKSLIRLSISSQTLSQAELSILTKEVKSKISRIKNISEVSVRGESDEQVSIEINSEAIIAYGLRPENVLSAISDLSYIFPVGDIEERGNFVFVSTANGKTDVKEWEDSILKLEEKYVRLGDIAKVKIEYPQTNTLSSFNNNTTMSLVISKGEKGNAIEIAKELRAYVEKIKPNYKEAIFNFYQDTSIRVKERLDTVIANLMFGLILVFLSMYLLINLRIAFIVALGIPFSFIIGLLFIYYMGYSINLVSLLGALIVIGIVVDDAIVVSENIQRHLDDGMEIREATLRGVKEMLLPVTLATITTVVVFIPMFMLNGEIALFLVLIPIVVIMILLGSLLESFLFLPLHAEEFLRKSHNLVDWVPLQDLYERVLSFHIHYKKTFLVLFLVLIPLLTIFTAKSMKFQFFPNFDGNYIYISGKLDINTPLEDTFKIAKEIEAKLIENGEEFSIKSTSATSGYRRSLSGETQHNNNVFFITLELDNRIETNWINRYVNPVLNFSFEFDQEGTRYKKTFELSPRVREIVLPYKEKYKMEELGVMEDKPGLIRSDIQINLSGSNDVLLEKAIKKLSKEIATLEGVTNFSDNIRYGKMEYKIKINSYGESLGLSEASVAKMLSGYFLEKRLATTFNERGVMEIKTEDVNKDKIASLLDFNIALGDGRFVKLTDIAEIIKRRDYEKIDKLNGNIVKTLFANVDKHKITPTEILSQLEESLNEIRNSGIEVNLLGEKEKKNQLMGDMKSTLTLAAFLILLTLLLIFSKIKYALMVMSVIPLSILGALVGHKLLGVNLTMPSIIGILGLSGVVINDGIIMLDFLHGTHKSQEFFARAKHRLRPIIITSVTTFLGMFTLIFFATGQAVILQPIAISIGFGLLWGTVLNLLYLPTLYALVNGIKPVSRENELER
ncbi:MAG: efflux RND transporter permease subunit [Epsilonproteobacteria bacterium]|nr:efflux RND transporter permease subunit [Campylobacterota bacterium]OIO16449.1 MAG: resistance-nodulation-cell division family transporter [Helicobacteraceae bacterium CG1_02_36_14]PIP10424.1 MAG: resistance-nodulation-cell division family transporter [Sulfurimonas sp. CG23_combo_of_CG06-09_8_20_14_all_36_33]PIS27047.1 MAG: AcrB/AcrD/AcrF family protein [Sulfurimonas sp. CG08_land_8_20_14_0_20_36_33]PIU33501.1 MAG: AcrB/AcrD/AcrF family protein [Sulfurimonas sp. CG07_land_8_20_14_0_80_36_56]